jgi:hypothetical protein
MSESVANSDHSQHDETDDEPPIECPLCLLDEIEPEHASASQTTNSYMRRIMAQELMGYGTTPDRVIYAKIARMYNRHIHKSMVESNLRCERWSAQTVRHHFEHHVWLLPRRVIGELIRQLTITMDVLKTERSTAVRIADGDETEIIEVGQRLARDL